MSNYRYYKYVKLQILRICKITDTTKQKVQLTVVMEYIGFKTLTSRTWLAPVVLLLVKVAIALK